MYLYGDSVASLMRVRSCFLLAWLDLSQLIELMTGQSLVLGKFRKSSIDCQARCAGVVCFLAVLCSV